MLVDERLAEIFRNPADLPKLGCYRNQDVMVLQARSGTFMAVFRQGDEFEIIQQKLDPISWQVCHSDKQASGFGIELSPSRGSRW
jgi:hypothetical protein